MLLKPVPQVNRLPIHRIGNHPVHGQTCFSGPFEHLQGQFPFRTKRHRVSNPSL